MSAPVLLFDGVCNLCNSVVQFVLTHDKNAAVRFASQQSAFGQRTMLERGLSGIEGVVLLEGERVYTHSDAALRLLGYLPAPLGWLSGLHVIPRGLREIVYRLIARNRYRLFGKRKACFLPRPEWKARFLEA
jgi:predicted DCC family thiol-disulfide oxidoreductase YuxK